MYVNLGMRRSLWSSGAEAPEEEVDRQSTRVRARTKRKGTKDAKTVWVPMASQPQKGTACGA